MAEEATGVEMTLAATEAAEAPAAVEDATLAEASPVLEPLAADEASGYPEAPQPDELVETAETAPTNVDLPQARKLEKSAKCLACMAITITIWSIFAGVATFYTMTPGRTVFMALSISFAAFMGAVAVILACFYPKPKNGFLLGLVGFLYALYVVFCLCCIIYFSMAIGRFSRALVRDMNNFSPYTGNDAVPSLELYAFLNYVPKDQSNTATVMKYPQDGNNAIKDSSNWSFKQWAEAVVKPGEDLAEEAEDLIKSEYAEQKMVECLRLSEIYRDMGALCGLSTNLFGFVRWPSQYSCERHMTRDMTQWNDLFKEQSSRSEEFDNYRGALLHQIYTGCVMREGNQRISNIGTAAIALLMYIIGLFLAITASGAGFKSWYHGPGYKDLPCLSVQSGDVEAPVVPPLTVGKLGFDVA